MTALGTPAADLDALRRVLGADGVALLDRLDEIARDPEREGTADEHEVAGDLATWLLVTYRQLRDASDGEARP